ncbi:PulJ/GspJ family protein [Aeromonas jandaei]|uniref:PulJ/GspJ family protein n=1 Tax=Aeromonas jandaei TaxID=650 RepID=UPI001115F7B0|nr:prepilin-type N-terminal cleavage/methylation domain-containing protein [Aeromonas jandaei]TNI07837.1 prepilin-type cleavage/methylation domain-containing protein [Aeromonas jandaei]
MVKQQGFSLLEAIVALTILAGASMALFGWIGGGLRQLNRSEFYIESTPALNSALEYLKFQDLASRPSGDFVSGDHLVHWQAVAIEKDVAGVQGSNFLLSLYDIELQVRKGQQSLPPLRTRIVNYHRLPGVAESQQDVN